MRPIHLSDLHEASSAILAKPVRDRVTFAYQIVENAKIADKWRKRTGKAHPLFGIGSLSSAVQGAAKHRTDQCCGDYRAALFVLLEALGNDHSIR